MKKGKRCPKCEGTDIAHADTVVDKNFLGEKNMSLGVERSPFKGSSLGTVGSVRLQSVRVYRILRQRCYLSVR